MNKFGMVLGLAAVATLAGCKDPDYKHDTSSQSQNEVKNVDTTPAKPVEIEPVAKKCTCAPGTRHTAPCTCGDPDCKCIVETKPVIVPAKSAEPEATVYVVQSGDYLAKISKKFNVTINSIKRLNPSIKNDLLRVGQKIKIPGKVDVGVQEAQPKTVRKITKKTVVYTGATKEYVVKNGDTLGSIAYGSGINIRQLKSMNGLTSDILKVGQKLKIPAEKVVKPAKSETKSETKVEKKVEKKAEAAPAAAPAEQAAPAEEKKPEETAPAAEEKTAVDLAPAPAAAEKKPEAPATTTYVVKEGDDMTGVSIRWGVSAADIRELNNLAEGDQLVPGQIIKLPADAQQ